jgi:septal ring factor EnvC (AmiA/AmiB activator)
MCALSPRQISSVPLVVLLAIHGAAQSPDTTGVDSRARRVNDRMRALQREADQLAREARTLVGDLRKLEIERDLRREEAARADAAALEAERQVKVQSEKLTALEEQRIAQLPDVKAQLVDMYKRGRAGYAQLLFGASDVREFARAARAVSALTAMNEKRLAEHRQTIEAVRQERAVMETTRGQLEASQAAARRARTAAERAVAAHSALITDIDGRRDLTAQYVGELQQAYEGIQQQVAELASGRAAPAVPIPLAPFRGALKWPVAGRVTGAYGQPTNRLGGSAVRSGIEIAAAEGTPVRAVHAGTVGYADPFTGFGTLVIVDHGGDNYSLYGYLGSISVARGDLVEEGTELGRVGGIPPALYFEMRIDGRSTDPIQWLEAR